MINLFKANLYRLFHAKVTYVILIITVIIYLLSFGVMRLAESGEASEDGVVTITYSEDYEPTGVNSYGMLADMMSSGFVALMLGIFSCVYSDEERKSGFLKNLPKSSRKKSGIFISKVFVVAFYSLLLTGIMFLASFLLAIRYRCSLEYDALLFAEYLFKQALLYTAFGTAMLAVFEVFRKGIIVIILTFVSAMVLVDCFSLFEALLVYKNIVSEKFIDLFGYSQYMIIGRSGALLVGNDNAAHVSTWFVGFASLLIYTVIGSLIYKKRDVI